MERTEKCELTVMCMLRDRSKILVQDRNKKDWPGISFPGGHVEKGESFVDAVKREFYEETGLKIENPKICGIKQWQSKNAARYIVLFFESDKFSGELKSSDEGEVFWIERSELLNYTLARDFADMVKVMESGDLNEFYYKGDPYGDFETIIL